MDRYQSTYVPGASQPGERDCDARWDVLADHLPTNGIVADIGSNLGYFGLRIVAERPKLAVLSIESDELIADRQARLIDKNGADRVVLLHGHLTAEVCERWADTCDVVDCTLLLSIVHWFDDPSRAVAALSAMSRTVLIEVPHADDAGACGQQHLGLWRDPAQWLRATTGRSVELIGRMDRHTSDVPSVVLSVTGPTDRQPSVPYWGWSGGDRSADFRIRSDSGGAVMVRRGIEQAYEPGLNIVSLMKLGRLLRPQEAHWRQQFDAALRAAPAHQDPLPHNCIWTPSGLRLIDDEQRDALTTANDGRRTFHHNLALWSDGATVSSAVEVRSLGRLQRLRRSSVGRAIIGAVPVRVRRAIREAVRRALTRRST